MVNGIKISPALYQPTPEGMQQLCQHYSGKYGISLHCLDLRPYMDSGDNIFPFFKFLSQHPLLLDMEENETKGVVLTHGKYHAVPVMLQKKEGTLHIFSFDSTAGFRVQGYFRIAALFPEARFYLNAGTRQADDGSCLTDAVCILKEALQLPDMVTMLESKIFAEHRAFQSSFFRTIERPSNFFLFKMPEPLLFTAQVSKYITEADADLNVILRNGLTLREYRDKYVFQVNLISDEAVGQVKSINSYLYVKSGEHKAVLDQIQANDCTEDDQEIIDCMNNTSSSPRSDDRVRWTALSR